MIEALQAAFENAAANIVFGCLVLLGFALVICSLLFFLLFVRGVWRWLTRRTWGDVVSSAERKVFLGGKARQGSR
jgi:hypothetical protein